MAGGAGAPGATTQGDVAMQPARLTAGFETNPLKNVKDDIKVAKRDLGKKKKKKKPMSFKEWQKFTSEDEINEGETNES